MKKGKIKRVSICAGAFLCLLLWGVRVYQVNAGISLPETKIYQMGETVPFGKDFYFYSAEIIDGYEVTVLSARLMTYQEFMAEYGQQEDYIADEWHRPRFVYDVEVEISNRNREEDNTRGINMINFSLHSVNDILQVNNDLFSMLYPHLDASWGFALRPESSMVMHIPYGTAGYQKYYTYEGISSTDWYLLLSMYPVKKMILVNPEI